MKHDRINEHQLQEMIQALPEKDVPAGLTERIMTEIYSPKQSFGQKISNLLTGSFAFNVQPLRLAGALSLLAFVFWIGLTLGGHTTAPVDSAQNISNRLIIEPENGEANFLIGRGLLAAGQWEQAVPYLQQASLLVPKNPEYALWEGVALGKLGNKSGELEKYKKTVDRHPSYVPARLYLGHTLLENRQPEAALVEYNQVLALAPDAGTALYNRALAYQLLGQKEQEAAAWREYLQLHRTGTWAYRAVEHLNEIGDFTFRSYQIGFRRIISNQELLLGTDSTARQREIDFLADSFRQATGNVLNIIVFQAGNTSLAGKHARDLKYSLSDHLNGTLSKNVNISWFGQPEKVRSASGKEFPLQKSLLIFSKPQTQNPEEKTI